MFGDRSIPAVVSCLSFSMMRATLFFDFVFYNYYEIILSYDCGARTGHALPPLLGAGGRQKRRDDLPFLGRRCHFLSDRLPFLGMPAAPGACWPKKTEVQSTPGGAKIKKGPRKRAPVRTGSDEEDERFSVGSSTAAWARQHHLSRPGHRPDRWRDRLWRGARSRRGASLDC